MEKETRLERYYKNKITEMQLQLTNWDKQWQLLFACADKQMQELMNIVVDTMKKDILLHRKIGGQR